MRFLADENFPAAVIDALRRDAHDVHWIRTLAPGLPDNEVLARALADRRVLLTFDRDFGELVFQHGAQASCGIVLFRLPMRSPESVAEVVALTLRSRSDWEGQFSVVDPSRIRMRTLPRVAGGQHH